MKMLRDPNTGELVLVQDESGYPGFIVEGVDVPAPGIDDIWNGSAWVFSPTRHAERLARDAAANPLEVGNALGVLGGRIAVLEESPSGGGLAGQVILNVPNNSISASASLAASGVTAESIVLIGLAPHTDADENTAEMIDLAAVSATPGEDMITVTAAFLTPHAGPIRFNWSAF